MKKIFQHLLKISHALWKFLNLPEYFSTPPPLNFSTPLENLSTLLKKSQPLPKNLNPSQKISSIDCIAKYSYSYLLIDKACLEKKWQLERFATSSNLLTSLA